MLQIPVPAWRTLCTVASGDDRERFWRRVTWESSLAISPRFFQLLTNFAHTYRSETFRNGFPVKFRIDMGRKDFKNHFFNKNSWKIVENRQNRLPDPRTYYGDPHCNFWLGTFSPRNFPDPKQSPEQKWGAGCSDQAKKWVGSAQG